MARRFFVSKNIPYLQFNTFIQCYHSLNYCIYFYFLCDIASASKKSFIGELSIFSPYNLDFYYERVLTLNSRNEVQDKTYICLEIEKNISELIVAKNTKFNGGSYLNKNPIIFSNDTSNESS